MENQMNIDYEREFLIDSMIAKSWEEEEYFQLKADMNEELTTKIEVADGQTTRISISDSEEKDINKPVEIFGNGL